MSISNIAAANGKAGHKMPAEIHTRNVHDDSMSEVTCTDLATDADHHAADHHDDIADKESVYGESVASTTSSLPSIKSVSPFK